ncbi:MAG: ABC transporter permease [Clostridia bacterium]|nr:ABC transporter permease [Clostridia bacterium]MBQ4543147.1 ABC transporter permease [Clostridia bacterium]
MLNIIIGILEQGFIFAIMALGIYISYKILDFPDLSVDGTFPLGAAVSTALILKGVNPWICLVAAAVAGALAGCLTGFFHVKLKIKDLLSGILTMTALYSINYRIAGSPNVFMMNEKTIFNLFTVPDSIRPYFPLIIIIVISLVAKILLDLYLKTKSGFLLKSAGDNAGLVVTLGENPGKIKIIGLALGNGLVALAGAVNCQRVMQFDVSSGVGTLVMGLAAVIIGTSLFARVKWVKTTTSVVIGMILYKTCITLAISSGLRPSDMNLVITVLFVITLVATEYSKRRKPHAQIKKH